jgi:hypothetical protein
VYACAFKTPMHSSNEIDIPKYSTHNQLNACGSWRREGWEKIFQRLSWDGLKRKAYPRGILEHNQRTYACILFLNTMRLLSSRMVSLLLPFCVLFCSPVR